MIRTREIRRTFLGRFLIMAALFLATLVPGSGCLFQTREAESPGEGGTSWVVPDYPNRVFSNLESGLEELNGTNYERSIGDNFSFVPLPGDKSNPTLENAFDGWNAEVEIEVMQKMLADARSIEVDFTDLQQQVNQISFAQYDGSYELTIISKSEQDTSVYKGKARFDFREGSKGWELIKWEDIESVLGFPTWGYLRGMLRLQ